jgi:8-oxo-dGTP pyrophosphatase MutT (NUDIX family)
MTHPKRPPIQAVAVVFIRDGRVLLGRRTPHRASCPGVWDLPCGRVNDGAIPRQAMVRKLREALGVHCSLHDVKRWKTLRIAGFELRLYFVHRWSGEPTNCDPDEHDELRWLTLAELDGEPVSHPKLRSVLLDAFACDRGLPPPPESMPIQFHQLSRRNQVTVLLLADGISLRRFARQQQINVEGIRASLKVTCESLGLNTQRALIDWFHHQRSPGLEEAS